MPSYTSFLLEHVFPYLTFNLILYVLLGMPLINCTELNSFISNLMMLSHLLLHKKLPQNLVVNNNHFIFLISLWATNSIRAQQK